MRPLTIDVVGQLSPSQVSANADLVVFLVIGVLAGAHCIGMCGPLVGLYSERMTSQSQNGRDRLTVFEVRQHTLFNSGRVVGYAFVGAVFGLLGGTFYVTLDTVATTSDGFRAATGLFVGGLVMLGGLGYILQGTSPGHSESIPFLSTLFGRVSGLLMRRVDRLATSSGIVGLGVVHAALPCPIIYPAYLYAFAIGDPVRGGLSLAVLGVGTFPGLFAYGTLLGSLSASTRMRLHRVLGVAFFALGYILVSHGLALLGVPVPHLKLPYYQPLTG